jgi:hypothetical protein
VLALIQVGAFGVQKLNSATLPILKHQGASFSPFQEDKKKKTRE